MALRFLNIACLVALQIMLGLTVGSSAAAQDPLGSPIAGRTLALEWCANCHLVAEDQEMAPRPDAPPFVLIARDPAVTEFWIRVFLVTPHERMPNFILTPDETDNIVAYILSLKE